MGRRKIEIQPITNERGRSVTFLKRKNGLFKKAYELGVLCSVDVAVIIFEQRTGHHVKLYEYCSSDVGSMIQRHIHFDGEKDARGPADFNNKQDGQGDDDDDDEADDGTGAISSKVGAKMGSGNKGAGISIGFGSGFGMDQDYRSEYQRSMSIPQPPLHQLQIPATPVQGQPSPSLYSATAHQSNAATLPVSIERHTSSASSNSSHNHHSHNHHHPGNNGYHTNQKTRINSGITGSYSQYGTLDESATPISAPAGSTPASASFRIQSNIFSQQSSNPQSSAAGGGASEQLSHYVNLQQSRAQQRGSQGSLHSPYSAGSYINQSYTGTGNQAASSSFSLLLEPGSIYRTHQTSAAPLSATSTSAFDWPVHANDHGPRSAHPSSGSSPQSHNFPARPQSQPANHQQNQTGDVTWLDFLSGTSSGGPNAANMNSGNAPNSTLSSLQQRRADDSWERGSHHSSTSTSQHGGTTPPSANLSKRQRSGSTSGVHIKEEPEGGGIGRASVVLGNATNGNVGETDIDELSDTSGSASGERKRQRWGEVN